MGKYEAKKTKRRKKRKARKSGIKTIAVVLGVLILTAVLVLFVMPQVLYRLSGDEDVTATEQVEVVGTVDLPEITEEQIPSVEYPVELEDGKLILEDLFQFEGMNPDCGMETGGSIASVTVYNASDAFLTEARLSLELADGKVVEFTVTDLPAGKKTMAFALDNTQLTERSVCVAVSGSAKWDNQADTMPQGISVFADGTTLTVTNNTAQEIPVLTVSCRDPFDESYFGGKAQKYIISNIPANGTATVEAQDSILGLPEVVRIAAEE